MREYRKELILLALGIVIAVTGWFVKEFISMRDDVAWIKHYLEWRDGGAGPMPEGP